MYVKNSRQNNIEDEYSLDKYHQFYRKLKKGTGYSLSTQQRCRYCTLTQ